MNNFTDFPEEDDFQDGFASGSGSGGGGGVGVGGPSNNKSWKNCFGGFGDSRRQNWTYHRIRMAPTHYADDRERGVGHHGGGGLGGGACRTCINITKWMPVVFISTVISWSYYAFVIQLCILAMQKLWIQILSLAVYHVALVLFLWAYWQTIFTGSSRVPRKFRIPSSVMERIESARSEGEVTEILEELVRTQQLPVQTRAHVSQIRYCEKCHIIKPDRAHHCSVCGYCVLKMDHHCPWVNNCVCFDNYKFFILFLAYAFLYCVVIFLISFPYFIDIWRGGWDAPMQGRFHILFVFFVAAMFAISLCSLLGYHCYLVTRNRSTLESFRSPVFRHGPDKKGFNLGAYNNFAEVFGEDKGKWLLPVFTSLGDGISFPTRHNWGSLNTNYNSLDTADSTPVSGRSPDHCVEVKVEARTEQPAVVVDSHPLTTTTHTVITVPNGGSSGAGGDPHPPSSTDRRGSAGGGSNGNGGGGGGGGGRNGVMTSPHKETPLVYF